ERVAGELGCAVRDHLVDVHVRLRPGARLPHDEREVVVELPLEDLVAHAGDQVRLLALQAGQLGVDERCRLLQHGEGADNLDRHPVPADLEVLPRPLGLGTPVAVGGDLDLAERVLLYPVLHEAMLTAPAAAARPRPGAAATARTGPRSGPEQRPGSAGEPRCQRWRPSPRPPAGLRALRRGADV